MQLDSSLHVSFMDALRARKHNPMLYWCSDVQPKRRRRLEKKADAMQIDMDSLWDD